MNIDSIPSPNVVTRFAVHGAELSGACRICCYKLIPCQLVNDNHVLVSSIDKGWSCSIHGDSCIGHLETDVDRKYTLMPSSLTPNMDCRANPYQRDKERLCAAQISEAEYMKSVSRMMMGKKGAIRSMNSIKVEGSIKMVISVGSSGEEGTVTIPAVIAKSTLVPVMKNGVVRYSQVRDGDYGILVRQPCLWPGGIQAVRIVVGEQQPDTSNPAKRNVDWTMKLPPEMCAPYAADFDGDQMSLFPVRNELSIQECIRYMWTYGQLADSALHNELIPQREAVLPAGFVGMSIRSTTCWSDTKTRGFRLTAAHKKCQLSVQPFHKFTRPHQSPTSFSSQANSAMTLAAHKSSMQSDVGALSRRSKLGAERVFPSRVGCPSWMSPSTATPALPIMSATSLNTRFLIGSPAVRAVSKITARIMQITLKVKSSSSLSLSSPTFTLLSGSTSWMCIMADGSVVSQSAGAMSLSNIEATPSIWHIKHLSLSERNIMCINCVKMCLSETRAQLDPMEFEYLVQLVKYCCHDCTGVDQGISVSTFAAYPNVPTLWRWNACYYKVRPNSLHSVTKSPSSLIERRFLCNFSSLTGILDDVSI